MKHMNDMKYGLLAAAILTFMLWGKNSAIAQEASGASLSPKVKLIWWSPEKSPEEITTQDLVNAGKVFDGFVVQRMHGTQDNIQKNEQFAWNAFSDRHYTLDGSGDDVSKSLAALVGLPSSPMQERFLRINTAPYHVAAFSWLDDNFWNNVVANLKIASRMVHDAKLSGIFLDTEQYDNVFYNYNALKNDPRYAGISYNDLAAIVEKRGRQVVQALNTYQPNIKILITHSEITVSQHIPRVSVSKVGVLLLPFLDGILDGSTANTKFIDGAEYAYWHDNNPNFFFNWRKATLDIKGYNGRFQKYPDRYQRQYEIGFGLFLDRDRDVALHNGVYGWCGDSKAQMFYSPAHLAYTVQQAVQASDEYVWVYTQKPNAWLPVGTPGGIPAPYAAAFREGQRHGNDTSLPALPADISQVDKADICGK